MVRMIPALPKSFKQCLLQALEIMKENESMEHLSFVQALQVKRTFYNAMQLLKLQAIANKFDQLLLKEYVEEYVMFMDTNTISLGQCFDRYDNDDVYASLPLYCD